MKIKTIALIGALSLSNAFAGSVSFTNLSGSPIFDNAGDPIDSSDLFAAVVTFATVPTNEAELRTALASLNVVNDTNQVAVVAGVQSAFNVAGDYTIGNEANLGDQLFLVLSGGTNFSDPTTPIGLIDSGEVVDADTPLPDSNTFLFSEGAGTLIVGRFDNGNVAPDQSALGIADAGTRGLFLVAVPEPSSALLFGLGGLLFVGRRRRA